MEGLVVTRTDRALVEVAANMSVPRLRSLVDLLVTDRRTSHGQLARCLSESARRGKAGVARFATVIDERGDGYVPPASVLEADLLTILADAGLPDPVRQIALPGRGTRAGLVDAGYSDCRLLIEADGRRWHSRLDAMRRDRQRDADAARAGWLTLRFMYEQIVHEPDDVATTVLDVYRTRLAQLAS